MENNAAIFNSALLGTRNGFDRFTIAVDVGGTNMLGAIMDNRGEIVLKKNIASLGVEPAEIRLIGLVGELLEESGLARGQLTGIGLGVPGVTDSTGQRVTLAPGLGWHDFDLGKKLQEAFSLPVWADNDVNAFLRGEHLLGSMINVRNGIAITIGTGIGAALLLNGEIYRGARGAAGEMGYWVLDSTISSQDSQGFGQFESFAAAPGITRRAQALMQNHRSPSILMDIAEGDLQKITAEAVFKAASLGDPQAREVVDDTIAVLGMTLANLSSVLDVEKIVIGGGVAEAGDLLIEPIQARISQLSPYPPVVAKSNLGSIATIIGAAAGLIENQLV